MKQAFWNKIFHGKKRNKIFQTLYSVFAVFLLTAVTAAGGLAEYLPEKYTVSEEQALRFSDRVPYSAASSPGAINVGSSDVAQISSHIKQTELRLCGIIPIKKVKTVAEKRQEVLLGGNLFGLKMFTDGIVVVGFHDVELRNPAAESGIRVGDIITAINGQKVTSTEMLSEEVKNAHGGSLILKINRNGQSEELLLTPEYDRGEQCHKVGLWVRDSTAGIGTVTFILPENQSFAALGHGIYDVDSGVLMPLSEGEILPITLSGVVKGKSGNPGELQGYFSDDGALLGTLAENSAIGIFGNYLPEAEQFLAQSSAEIAWKQEIIRGKAQIISSVSEGGAKYYDVEIERINYKNTEGKNLVIHVTDEALLAQTGGIVQGMSGSPIVQNGRMIGAVTHVFVNDSTRGYGIFAEDMLKAAQGLTSGEKRKNVS